LIIFGTVGFVGWVKYYLKFYGESLNYICIFDVIKYYFPWHDIDEVNIWRRGQDNLAQVSTWFWL